MSKTTATRTLSQSPAAIAKRAARAAAKVAPVTVNLENTATVETDAPIDFEALGYDAETLGSVDIDPVRDEPASGAPVETAPVETATYSKTLAEAIEARMQVQESADLVNARNAVLRGAKGIDALYAKPAFASVLDSLIASIKVGDKRDARFIAVKALVKIVHGIGALASGTASEFDPYSRTIISNLAGVTGLTNKSALVCLSKSITYDALDAQQALTRRYNCSAGTATTQASSTRMMLMHLGLCSVVKGKQGDVTTIDPANERATALLALFA